MSHEIRGSGGPVPASGGPHRTTSAAGDTGMNPDDTENRSFLGNGAAFAFAVIGLVFVAVVAAYAVVLAFAAR